LKIKDFHSVVEKYCFPIFLTFSLICIILSIGNFDRALAIQDKSTSGIFSTNLILYPEIYKNDIISFVTNIGYLNPLVLAQVFLKKNLNIDPYYLSYFFLVLGNFLFIFGFFKLTKYFAKENFLSCLIALISLGVVIVDNNIANFGPRTSFQTFPDINFYALGIICYLFFKLLERNFIQAIFLVELLIFFHLGHALLILPIFYLTLICNLIGHSISLEYFIKTLSFSLLCILTIFLIYFFNISVSDIAVSNNHIFSFISGTVGGHIYPWEYEKYPNILLNFFGVFIVFTFFYKKINSLNKEFWILFFSILSFVCLYAISHFLILFFEVKELIRFIQILPMRSSVYIQLLIFPVLIFYILSFLMPLKNNWQLSCLLIFFILVGSHKSFASWIIFDLNYLNLSNFVLIKIISAILISIFFYFLYRKISDLNKYFLPYFLTVIFSCFIFLESFNLFYGSNFSNKKDHELVQLLKWMNKETPSHSRFITIEYDIQMNGLSNRSTFRPFPFIPEVYRVQDLETEKFSDFVLDFWNLEKLSERGWFDNFAKKEIYKKFSQINRNDIEYLADISDSNFLISKAKDLDFEVVFFNETYFVYLIN
jgi:hypothetical protein